jgi:hypothetical protein
VFENLKTTVRIFLSLPERLTQLQAQITKMGQSFQQCQDAARESQESQRQADSEARSEAQTRDDKEANARSERLRQDIRQEIRHDLQQSVDDATSALSLKVGEVRSQIETRLETELPKLNLDLNQTLRDELGLLQTQIADSGQRANVGIETVTAHVRSLSDVIPVNQKANIEVLHELTQQLVVLADDLRILKTVVDSVATLTNSTVASAAESTAKELQELHKAVTEIESNVQSQIQAQNETAKGFMQGASTELSNLHKQVERTAAKMDDLITNTIELTEVFAREMTALPQKQISQLQELSSGIAQSIAQSVAQNVAQGQKQIENLAANLTAQTRELEQNLQHSQSAAIRTLTHEVDEFIIGLAAEIANLKTQSTNQEPIQEPSDYSIRVQLLGFPTEICPTVEIEGPDLDTSASVDRYGYLEFTKLLPEVEYIVTPRTIAGKVWEPHRASITLRPTRPTKQLFSRMRIASDANDANDELQPVRTVAASGASGVSGASGASGASWGD